MATTWKVIGIMAVAMVWLVSAGANMWAGMQLAPDSAGGTAWILGGASVAADVLKTVCLFVIVAAVADKRWAGVAVASTIMVLCVFWSLRAAVYFSSSMIATKVAERQLDGKLLQTELDLIELNRQRAAFLSQQKIKLPGSGRPLREALLKERKRVSDEYAKTAASIEARLEALRTAEPKPAVDPIAAVLKIDEGILFAGTSVAFALLLEFISAAGLWAVAHKGGRGDRGPKARVAPAEPPRPPPEETVVGYGGRPVKKDEPGEPPAQKQAQRTPVQRFVDEHMEYREASGLLCTTVVGLCMAHLGRTMRKPERDAMAKELTAEIVKLGGERKKTGGSYKYLHVRLTK